MKLRLCVCVCVVCIDEFVLCMRNGCHGQQASLGMICLSTLAEPEGKDCDLLIAAHLVKHHFALSLF